MTHASTRVQVRIGDPVSDKPAVTRPKLEEIFKDIQSDLRYDHELNGCLNCGICTATCPAAHYYDFSPREIVQLLWTENLEGIYDAMQEKIWACGRTGRDLGVSDHGSMNWDEVVAFLLVLLLTPEGLGWQLSAFVLFRFFDVVKPPPIDYFDRTLKGGFGVMFDDLLAAFYALLAMAVARQLWPVVSQ